MLLIIQLLFGVAVLVCIVKIFIDADSPRKILGVIPAVVYGIGLFIPSFLIALGLHGLGLVVGIFIVRMSVTDKMERLLSCELEPGVGHGTHDMTGTSLSHYQSIPSSMSLTKTNGSDPRQEKQCPLCGEDILLVAIKCKYCGSDIPNEDSLH